MIFVFEHFDHFYMVREPKDHPDSDRHHKMTNEV